MLSFVVVAAVGAIFGAGAWMLVRAMRPEPIPMSVLLDAIDRRGVSVAEVDTGLVLGEEESDSFWVRLGRGVVDTQSETLLKRLRLIDKTPQQYGAEKVSSALLLLLVFLGAGVILIVMGFALPWYLVVGLGLGGGVLGWVIPDLQLNTRAVRRRTELRYQLSAFLDLTVMMMSAGTGLETALMAAANAGDGWLFRELRVALSRAARIGQSPWDAFDHLGSELDDPDLHGVAAAARLAGGSGALIRDSIATRAETLRSRLHSELESAAEESVLKRQVPVTLMVFSIMVYLIYGALSTLGSSVSLRGAGF
ncbi:MAG: hypothetical protein GEU79_07875 [Acidimicrobiia bacterium]|nr:hypothetical protein [Acidimicrobiia bacterium]